MSGVAGASWAAFALWIALLFTGLLTGTLVARWNAGDSRVPPAMDGLLLAAAAASTVAWFASAGSLIGSSSANELLNAYNPVEGGPGFRLALLWATLPGAALTSAAALLVVAALTGSASRRAGPRRAALLASLALLGLSTALWFWPPPDANATTIPPFVQHPSGAAAPLFALVSLILVAVIFASRGVGPAPAPALILAAWVAATLSVASEQLARSRLGIGPRDALVLGHASSGLVLWLATSAFVHRRVQGALFSVAPTGTARTRSRYAGLAAHTGAVLLIVSFAAHAFAARSTIQLPAGSRVEVRDSFRRPWMLANQGVSHFDAAGVDVLSLAVEAQDPGGKAHLLTPAIHDHHGRDGRHLDNSISLRASTGGSLSAMRILLLEADSLDVASVRVTFLPVPFLWPAGIALLLLSAVLALPGDRRALPTE